MIEHTGQADTPTIRDGFAGQPIVEVERDGVHYTLLGTAHVSKASIDAVLAAIDSGRFDAVAVELDEQRHKALTQPDTLAQLEALLVELKQLTRTFQRLGADIERDPNLLLFGRRGREKGPGE
mgnify:CR=1 FL=1